MRNIKPNLGLNAECLQMKEQVVVAKDTVDVATCGICDCSRHWTAPENKIMFTPKN